MRVATQKSAEARAIPLYDGGVVTSRPADAASVYAARARADALVAALSEAGHAVSRAGGEVQGVPDLSDAVERQGVWDAMFALSLAEMLITGWSGVVAENGEALEFRSDRVVHLMRDARAADLYVGQILEPERRKAAEKKS
ncbi:hypothetical protein [Pelagibacterium montanilacus]|uniref:hypothetical protein n=1 Tax=Pelagibacterium montanilacus TaxID=2185280 RepID=UPI000F8CBAFF|nr:hypothetical protein [Pelagibacterium montanilacus]